MIWKIILLLTIAQLSFQQCSIGCLRCNSNNQCLLCDTSKNFLLTANSCTNSTDANCRFFSQTGACVQCALNYYVDLNTQKCVIVSPKSVVQNCAVYSSTQACTVCLANYYISIGTCVAVVNSVPNCAFYLADAICSECNPDYILSIDNTKCVSTGSAQNCQLFTYATCNQCATNYFLNQNLYFSNYSTAAFVNNLLNNQSPNFVQFTNGVQLQVCIQGTVTNCAIYSSFNNCTACVTGFYMVSGVCVANPNPTIFGCSNYTNLLTCSNCKSGFYLNLNRCNPNIPITSCTIYSTGSVSTTTCLQCDQLTYLSANACVARINSLAIANCQTISNTTDTCSVCSTGFVLTGDSLICLPNTPFCLNYASGTTLSSSSINCLTCLPLYYITSASGVNSCTAGNVTNCAVYNNTQTNVCTTCNNGFYLLTNKCIAHVNIPNCLTYSQTTANFCSICTIGFYNFMYNKVCSAVNSIPGCLTYAVDGLSCSVCQTGYYPTASTCTLIPSTFPNCIGFTGTACTACSTGFMVNTLITLSQCSSPFDYLTLNCIMSIPTPPAIWLGASSNPINCVTCGPNMYSYTPVKSEAICVLTTQLPLYSSFSTVSNCIRYGISYAASPLIVCMQCATGNYISGYSLTIASNTATSCVGSCSTSAGLSVIIPDDLLGFVNICAPTASNGGAIAGNQCQKYARSGTATMAINDFTCILASTGNVLTYTFPSTGMNFEPNDISLTTFKTATRDYFHGFTSADANTNNVIPSVFNFRGVNFGLLATPTLLSGVSLSNCLIVWTIGVGSIQGSAYRTGGGSGGAYAALTTSQPSCLRCSSGFRPLFTITASTGNFPIPNCVSFGTACQSSTVIFGGLPIYLVSLTSCHYCTQITGQNAFPILYLEVDAVSTSASANVIQYSLPVVTGTTAAPGQGFSCGLPPTPITISATSPTTIASINNCAYFGVFSPITTYQNDPTLANINNFCLACATGSYPIYYYTATGSTSFLISAQPFYIPSYAVVSCVTSNKCDNTSQNTPWNSCGKCTKQEESLAIPNYYAYTDWRFINCIITNTQNCFIVFTTGATTLSATTMNPCGVCMAGYFLNKDSFCDFLTIPNQSSGASFVNAYFSTFYLATSSNLRTGAFDINQVRVHYQLSLSGLQYGVTSCATSYTLASPFTVSNSICVLSSYLLATTTFPSGTFYIQNCLQYNMALVNNKLFCFKCITGMIPTSDGLSCVVIIPSCLVAMPLPSTNLCATCSTGFLNYAGICSTNIILNCSAYNNGVSTFSLSNLQCQTCNSGFYLSTDSLSCLAGNVVNCQTYTQGSATSCTGCLSGFTLMTIASSANYCYPVPAVLNCQTLADQSASNANSALVVCTRCLSSGTQVYGVVNWVQANTASLPQSLCMPFNLIANCVAYDQGNTVIALNSYRCTACANGYFLSASTNSCITRTVVPLNCTAFSPTADLCTGCSSLSFLATNGLSCIPHPNGIFNCAVYSTNTTCLLCSSGSYLSNSQCLTSTFISNCLTYSGNNVCKTCAVGYFLQNPTTCVQATATGCLNYTSISVCAACPVGSALSTSSGVTSCIAVNVSNCAVPTTLAPYTCVVCSSGYFTDSTGVCQKVTSPISNCLSYFNGTVCLSCAQGFVLSPNGNLCQSTLYSNIVDANCAQSAVLNTPQCAVCAFGYYFMNGTCQACTGQSLASGCASCNPTNNSVCLFCSSGYSQNALGNCVMNPIEKTNFTTNNGTNSSKLIGIRNFCLLLLGMIVLSFKES